MDVDEEPSWIAEAHFTGPNYQAKKTVFLLFINRKNSWYFPHNSDAYNQRSDRLVESASIRRSLEAIYTGVMPKGASPYVYLRYLYTPSAIKPGSFNGTSLQIDPRSVDVNVHPTKREVHFLDEEQIVQKICDTLLDKLMGQNQSKTFEYQVRCC